MPLIGENVLQMIRSHRVVYFGGRFGSYKTAGSVRLSIEFMERGWAKYMISNFPCVVASDPRKLPELRDTVIVLDEGGAGDWLNENSFGQAVAFMRKRNLYLIIPSYSPPPRRAQGLNVQMIFDGHASGLDFLVYSTALDNMRVHERNKLTWYRPSEVYGLYDTGHMAFDDGGLLIFMEATFRADGMNRSVRTNPNDLSPLSPYDWGEIAKKFRPQNSKANNPPLPSGQGILDVETFRGVAADAAEAADRLREEALSLRKYRRR